MPCHLPSKLCQTAHSIHFKKMKLPLMCWQHLSQNTLQSMAEMHWVEMEFTVYLMRHNYRGRHQFGLSNHEFFFSFFIVFLFLFCFFFFLFFSSLLMAYTIQRTFFDVESDLQTPFFVVNSQPFKFFKFPSLIKCHQENVFLKRFLPTTSISTLLTDCKVLPSLKTVMKLMFLIICGNPFFIEHLY